MEIINGNALEIIENLSDDIFDLIILDPDYQEWDKLIAAGFIEKCLMKLKNDGNLIIFTKQPFDYNLRIHINPIFRREISWSFENGGAWVSNKMPLVSFQKIFWCVKSKGFYFNPRTGMGYSENTKDFKRSKKVFGGYEGEGHQFNKSPEGVWLRDHLHFNKPQTGAIPSKPKELIRILIKCFCKPDGLIFNPFAGSGIIEQTAYEENRNIISVEIEKERCQKILDRFFKKTELEETQNGTVWVDIPVKADIQTKVVILMPVVAEVVILAGTIPTPTAIRKKRSICFVK